MKSSRGSCNGICQKCAANVLSSSKVLLPNYAFKPIAEQAIGSNQTIVPQRLNAALDLQWRPFVNFGEFSGRADPVCEIFEEILRVIYDKRAPNRERLERISEDAKRIYLVYTFDCELQNGGFDQLLSNLGAQCIEISAELAKLGLELERDLLQRALSWIPTEIVGGKPSALRRHLVKLMDNEAYCNEVSLLDEIYHSNSRVNETLREFVCTKSTCKIRA